VTAGLIPVVPPAGDERCESLAAAVARAHGVLALTDRQILADALQAPDARADWIASNRTYAWHYAVAQVLRPLRIGEIGVRFGYSLKALALGAAAGERARPEVRGWDGEADGITSNETARQVLLPAASPVQIRRVNTADLATLDVEGLDVFHVDGDHTERGASRDMELAWGALRPGGVLLVDDCDFIPAVRRAVDAFCLRRGLARRFLPTFRGTALLVKPESD
jgi:predicted O-methyltransferase YrrM